MKRLLFLIFLLFIAGCTKEEAYPTVQEKLYSMESYTTDANITYISNKGENSYDTSISALSDGKYRIDIKSPKEYEGSIIMYDGKLVWHYNPHIEDKKISASPPDKESRREIILFSFLKNYSQSMESTAATANEENSQFTVLEAQYPSGKIFSRERLFINNEDINPHKLVIYDNENKERIVVKFTNFSYNCKIDENAFKLQ